ncbi:MAG: cupin domain-containing protein [Gemmatimonadota bacterium]
MRIRKMTAFLLVAAAAASIGAPAIGAAQGAATKSTPTSPELKWGPAPPIFPAGAQMAVLQGDPGGHALFTVRLRLPDGYLIAPHTHPTDEQVTVISGTFKVGMGKTFTAKEMMTLAAGGFVVAPAEHPHYAIAQGFTVVQVHAMGPFAMTYVNPADTPKAAASR